MKKALEHNRIRQDLLEAHCDYITMKMNVPQSSHMGGVWERMIRTTRNALSALLVQHGIQLDDETLRTLMTEAEAIVYNRPLTYVDTDAPGALESLSPNQILTMKSNVVLSPTGEFQNFIATDDGDVCLANEEEFLPTLKKRKRSAT